MANKSTSPREPSDLEGNPFAALFPSMSEAIQYVSQVATSDMVQETLKGTQSEHEDLSSSMQERGNENEKALDVKRIVNNLLQRIFLITLQDCKSFCSL